MKISKAINFNKYFLAFQLIAFVVDILLTVFCDISVYFVFMWVIGVIVVIYDGLIGSIITRRVIYKKPEYQRIINKYPYAFTDWRIVRLARKINDTEVKKFLNQQFLSFGILAFNVLYVLAYTVVFHPENIG